MRLDWRHGRGAQIPARARGSGPLVPRAGAERVSQLRLRYGRRAGGADALLRFGRGAGMRRGARQNHGGARLVRRPAGQLLRNHRRSAPTPPRAGIRPQLPGLRFFLDYRARGQRKPTARCAEDGGLSAALAAARPDACGSRAASRSAEGEAALAATAALARRRRRRIGRRSSPCPTCSSRTCAGG